MQIDSIKGFYLTRSETNWTKRYESPYLLRRYFSRTMWQVTVDCIPKCPMVLDAGCGDGVLSVLMALGHRVQRVVAMDISLDGVRRTRHAAILRGVADRIIYVVADAENLPFKNSAFPAVASCQVLEHLPNFDHGAREIRRVLHPNGVGVIAIPACLNPSAIVLLGGDDYWCIRKRTLFAFWKGLARLLWAWLRGEEGVQEGYAGQMELPHIRRFPWRAVQRMERNGLKVAQWMADSLLVPYLAFLSPPLIRLQEWADECLREKRLWRNFGVGIVMVVSRKS
ncbi:MAG: class I SAM-dependent methyltransferase [Candidatus Binatia bacterium]